MNFAVLWLFTKVSSAKFGAGHLWHGTSEQSVKVFSSESFLLYGNDRQWHGGYYRSSRSCLFLRENLTQGWGDFCCCLVMYYLHLTCWEFTTSDCKLGESLAGPELGHTGVLIVRHISRINPYLQLSDNYFAHGVLNKAHQIHLIAMCVFLLLGAFSSLYKYS